MNQSARFVLVSRPRRRHHPDQCLCRDCLRRPDPRRLRSGPHQPGPAQLSSRPAATRSRSSSRTRSSSARTSTTKTRPGAASYKRAATKPGSLWYAHTYEPNPLAGRWDLAPGASPSGSIGRPRVLRRHHAGQRHDLPAGHRPGAALPPAPPQRLQRPVPEPAALCRRRQPERNHAGQQRHPDKHSHS